MFQQIEINFKYEIVLKGFPHSRGSSRGQWELALGDDSPFHYSRLKTQTDIRHANRPFGIFPLASPHHYNLHFGNI